jgi:hypothetical protein
MWVAPPDRKQPTPEHFDDTYRGWADFDVPPTPPDRYREILDITGPWEGLKVLDLGGGPTMAAAAQSAREYLLVDYSAEACRVLRKFYPSLRVECRDALDFLGGNAERFDLTISFGLVEYLPPGSLETLFRLAPSPRFCLGMSAAEGYLKYEARLAIYSKDDADRAAAACGWRKTFQANYPSHVWASYERVGEVPS